MGQWKIYYRSHLCKMFCVVVGSGFSPHVLYFLLPLSFTCIFVKLLCLRSSAERVVVTLPKLTNKPLSSVNVLLWTTCFCILFLIGFRRPQLHIALFELKNNSPFFVLKKGGGVRFCVMGLDLLLLVDFFSSVLTKMHHLEVTHRPTERKTPTTNSVLPQ